MHPLFRLALAALLLLARPSAAGGAERSPGTYAPIDGTNVIQRQVGEQPWTSTACPVGETRDVGGFIGGYLAPPGDTFFTLLRPSSCSNCPAPARLLLTNAHLRLGFQWACSMPVLVSVVGSVSGPGCPVPNRNDVICPPTRYDLDSPGGELVEFGLALPSGCCISDDAFLVIEFLHNDQCPINPLLGATAAPCTGCSSWNDNPAFGFVDICSDPFWPSADGAGNPAMWVEADCCSNVVPVLPTSWSGVKAHDR